MTQYLECVYLRNIPSIYTPKSILSIKKLLFIIQFLFYLGNNNIIITDSLKWSKCNLLIIRFLLYPIINLSYNYQNCCWVEFNYNTYAIDINKRQNYCTTIFIILKDYIANIMYLSIISLYQFIIKTFKLNL